MWKIRKDTQIYRLPDAFLNQFKITRITTSLVWLKGFQYLNQSYCTGWGDLNIQIDDVTYS